MFLRVNNHCRPFSGSTTRLNTCPNYCQPFSSLYIYFQPIFNHFQPFSLVLTHFWSHRHVLELYDTSSNPTTHFRFHLPHFRPFTLIFSLFFAFFHPFLLNFNYINTFSFPTSHLQTLQHICDLICTQSQRFLLILIIFTYFQLILPIFNSFTRFWAISTHSLILHHIPEPYHAF